MSPFPSPLPTPRPRPPSPIHKHRQPLFLPPACKKSSLSRQLCDSEATYVLRVLQAMKSGMESSKDLGQGLPCLLLWVGKEWLLLVMWGDTISPTPPSSGLTLCSSFLFQHCWYHQQSCAGAKQGSTAGVSQLLPLGLVVMKFSCCSLSLIQSALHFLSQLQCCCADQFLSLAAGPRFLTMAAVLSEASP